MKSGYHKKIFESYLNESPESLNRVDHWEKYGANSIKIFYKDGSKAIYHIMMRTLRGFRKNNGSESEWKRDFRDELVERMYDCGYTQESFANAIGVTQPTLSNYLNKRAVPSGYIISKMARVLHCTPNDLIQFDNR